MRVAIISDLHISPSARGDTFGHDPRSFQHFLDTLEDAHDHIVLLGDTYQCDHGWAVTSSLSELEAAQARSPWLTRRLRQPGYTLVYGNHDVVLREQGVVGEVWLGRGDPYPALLFHGDAFDPVIQRAPLVSGLATWASGRLRRGGLRPLAQWLEDRDVQLKGQRFQTHDGPYASGARARMRAEGARIVVMGHTHVPWHYEVEEGIILNSGTCSRGQRMYASLDTVTGATCSVPFA